MNEERKPVVVLFVGNPRLAGRGSRVLEQLIVANEARGVIVEFALDATPYKGTPIDLMDTVFLEEKASYDPDAFRRLCESFEPLEMQVDRSPPLNKPWYRVQSRKRY